MDYYPIAAHAQPNVRAAFIRRTYGHLAGAILAFVALETALLSLPNIKEIVDTVFMTRMSWIMILLGFMAVGWIAERLAQSDASPAVQYFGLALYICAEAVIFLPLLYIASNFYAGAIPTAGILTLAVFGGLTMTVFVTRKDFSFLRPILAIGSFIALGVIIAALFIPGANFLGIFFCFAMVALISGYILYYTSNVLLHYRTDRHVAASLALFASIATLFWYILQIVMMTQSRD
jgi:FtsH-binding integral membrane protein